MPVMPALVAGIHVFGDGTALEMAGTSAAIPLVPHLIKPATKPI